jgi:hypothetical protein
MTRDEYNKKVQAMQAVWPESALRFKKLYDRSERLTGVRFQVYLDHWRTLGTQQHPFQPFAEYEWNEDEEARVMYHLAGAVTSDRALPRN